MPYHRKRRSAPGNPPPMDDREERVYTEEDYAVPSAEEPLDEWEAPAYLPADDPELTPEDEAFAPDGEEAWPAEDWQADPFSVPGRGFAFEGEPMEDDLDEDDLDDDLLTDEDRAELRRSNWAMLAGLADFAGVILGTAAILVIVALLVSLLNWLMADVSQSFVLLQKNF